MKILTFNTSGTSDKMVKNTIADFDVALIQEGWRFWGWPFRCSVDKITPSGFHNHKTMMHRESCFVSWWLGIITKSPIQWSFSTDIHKDDWNRKALGSVTRDLAIVTAHFGHDQHSVQMERVLGLFDSMPDRLVGIIGGDFNAEPQHEMFNLLASHGFRLATVGKSFPSSDPNKQIDYIWVRGANPVKFWVAVDNPGISDHCALACEVV